MNFEELLKKPGAREAIIKVATLLKKAGADANTKFDESVPAVAQPVVDENNSGNNVSSQANPDAVAAAADQQGQPAAAPAVDPAVMGGQIDPGMEGAMAAQSFLAPIMEAAMNGDPNAQAIIAQASGAIAKGVAEAAAGAMGAAPADMQPAAAVMPAAAVPAKTPEEAVADQIVPENKEEQAPPAEKKEDVMKTASINADLLKQLLDLARSGKI